jgi:hypothetical protein
MFRRDRGYYRGYRGYRGYRHEHRRHGMLRWIAEALMITGIMRFIRRSIRGY